MAQDLRTAIRNAKFVLAGLETLETYPELRAINSALLRIASVGSKLEESADILRAMAQEMQNEETTVGRK